MSTAHRLTTSVRLLTNVIGLRKRQVPAAGVVGDLLGAVSGVVGQVTGDVASLLGEAEGLGRECHRAYLND